jgi:Zn-dependent oligopeptidase
MTNPFFKHWTTKYQAVPFDEIKFEHFMPAIEKALEIAKQKVNELKSNSEAPDFRNTILALQTATEDLNYPVGIYFNLLSSESDNEFKSLAEKISPMISQFSSELNMDPTIFERVKYVYNNMKNEDLSAEEKRLVEKTYLGFTRNGALLDDDKKKQLLDIDMQLSVLSPKFSKNVLDATNAYFYHTTDKNEVEGIPENDLKAAEYRAKQKGKDSGWLFNLQAPSITPVLTYAKNRELRKRISLASGKRAFKDDFDNCDIILKEVNLRYKRAKLLGFNSHSDYVLEQRMAENPKTVNDFLDRIFEIALPAAQKEVQEVKEFAKKVDSIDDLMPWDFTYYAEKLKKDKFGFDEEELKPYFKAESCVAGIFKVAEKLYDLSFIRNNEIPVYHKDVEVYEVFNNEDFVGLFYIDLYPRETKRGGAWMTTYKTQGLFKGKIDRPHVGIVGNLTPSTEDTPSLLGLREVETLFHEFGHALHGLLSDCVYSELASPNVYWDFVELPSQIMENWVLEDETLELFAHHYKTNELIPRELIDKVKAAKNFNKGYFNLRQLTFGVLDMAWHTINPENINDVKAYEDEVTDKFRLLPKVETSCISTGLSHIFAGGYSSGYYSYKWAEVLEADAFEKFLEDGIFNKETASSFKDNILARGNTAHPMDLYVKFRGRKPDADAMLRRDGLL